VLTPLLVPPRTAGHRRHGEGERGWFIPGYVDRPRGHVPTRHDAVEVHERDLSPHRLAEPDVVWMIHVAGVPTPISISEQARGIELVIVRPRLPIVRRCRRDAQRNRRQYGRLEDAFRSEQRHAAAVELKSLCQHSPRERLTVELRLLLQEGERCEADALTEVHERRHIIRQG